MPQDLPPGVPVYAMGAAAHVASQAVATPTPTLLARTMALFHPTPSPIPALINRSANLERQLDALQMRSSPPKQ